MRKRPHRVPRGFSLLEVILALAILTGAIAALGEVARQGMRCGRIARDTARAQLICESKLNEITAGIAALSSVSGSQCDVQFAPSDPPWIYSVDVSPASEPGFVIVTVTVTQDVDPAFRPVKVSLVRWMLDPNYTATTSTTSEAM